MCAYFLLLHMVVIPKNLPKLKLPGNDQNHSKLRSFYNGHVRDVISLGHTCCVHQHATSAKVVQRGEEVQNAQGTAK